MKENKLLLLNFIVLFVVCFSFTFAFAQLPAEEFSTLRITGQGTVDTKGNLHINLNWKFPTNAFYIETKKNFPNPYILLREFTSQRSALEVANAGIKYDDANRSIRITADFLGTAVNKKGRWEIDMGKETDCIFLEKERGIFLQVLPVESQIILVMDMILNLPPQASNAKYNEKKGILTYSLPEKITKGYPELELSLKCKPRLMAATYKAYGNREILDGSMWVAKAIFKNSGKGNIRNLKISYKLGDYSEWSIPHTYSLVVPGGYVVDLYYPVISSKITELLTRTPVDVQIKYSYEDEEGKKYEEFDGERTEILGINQIEFCNLTIEERTGTWADNFSNSPLLAAWVTHLDPPVKALAGMVSQLAGGVPTALDQESAIKFCRALYELEIANGMVYQTPSGFLEEYAPGQDIKYPRDVLRDKSGTCVDLAILYASVCEAVGLKTILVTIPGHCFPVVILPGGGLLPVECTAISGVAVGEPKVKSLSFDKAVRLASREFQNLQVGRYYLVNVEEMWQQGVVSPELPRLEADILQRWGWHLPQMQQGKTQPERPIQQQTTQQPPMQTTTTTANKNKKYSSKQHGCSFLYPEGWKVQENQNGVNIEEPQGLAWITIWKITDNIDPEVYLQKAENYLKQNWKNYTVTSRSEVKINTIDALRVDGHYAPAQGKTEIFTILVLYKDNQARLMVGSGIIKEQYANLSSVMEKIFQSITLADTGQTTTPRQTQQPQTTRQTGDGSEGIKILRNLARGGNPPPLSQVTPPSDWVHVAHPTIYMLKLIRPPDWKEEVMQDASGYYGGLKIISPDSRANLFVYHEVAPGGITIQDAIKEGTYLLTTSHSQVDVVVKDDLHKFVSAMWPGADARFIAFRFQGKVGVLLCMIFPMSGGQATQVHLKGCIGPADKFDTLTKEVFLKVFGWVGAGGYITPAPRG